MRAQAQRLTLYVSSLRLQVIEYGRGTAARNNNASSAWKWAWGIINCTAHPRCVLWLPVYIICFSVLFSYACRSSSHLLPRSLAFLAYTSRASLVLYMCLLLLKSQAASLSRLFNYEFLRKFQSSILCL